MTATLANEHSISDNSADQHTTTANYHQRQVIRLVKSYKPLGQFLWAGERLLVLPERRNVNCGLMLLTGAGWDWNVIYHPV